MSVSVCRACVCASLCALSHLASLSLSLFDHQPVQERRKYGPNGWNIPYEWNTSDLNASVQSLRMYLEEQDVVPWEALQYIVGTINYGGRVTDFLDLRCVKSILAKYFNPKILEDEYPFTTDGELPRLQGKNMHAQVLERKFGAHWAKT